MSKVKDKKRILKIAREKYKRKAHKAIGWIFSRNFAGQKGVALHIQSLERKKTTTKNTLPGKVIIQNKRKESFPDKN